MVSMAVKILLFAAMAERAGARSIEFEYLQGDTVAAVRDRLIASRPELAEFTPTLLYAIDEEYVREGELVPDGATLAFIPPVSGG
jgi:molybdopterin converting factor subunit 1